MKDKFTLSIYYNNHYYYFYYTHIYISTFPILLNTCENCKKKYVFSYIAWGCKCVCVYLIVCVCVSACLCMCMCICLYHYVYSRQILARELAFIYIHYYVCVCVYVCVFVCELIIHWYQSGPQQNFINCWLIIDHHSMQLFVGLVVGCCGIGVLCVGSVGFGVSWFGFGFTFWIGHLIEIVVG